MTMRVTHQEQLRLGRVLDKLDLLGHTNVTLTDWQTQQAVGFDGAEGLAICHCGLDESVATTSPAFVDGEPRRNKRVSHLDKGNRLINALRRAHTRNKFRLHEMVDGRQTHIDGRLYDLPLETAPKGVLDPSVPERVFFQ